MRPGTRIEITDRPPYYVHLDHGHSRNTKLYLLLVGCRGTVTETIVTWDGVPYASVKIDEDGETYGVGTDWCVTLSVVDCLAELV